MRIYSWNVNGFRSVLKQGFVDWLDREQPDVLSLQEIRAEWAQIDDSTRQAIEARYDVCWFPASSKKGYAGSATLSKRELGLSHRPGLGIDEHDREGRIVQSRLPFATLIAGYFPNASSELVRLPYKRKFSADLTEIVRQRHARGERVIVVGDLNVAPEEIDLANPATNRRTPGFTDEEREDFRGYLGAGLVDVLRQRNPTAKGLYTWWSMRGGARSRNVGWRLDIFLVSEPLATRVREARIHADVLGSDHCPVSIEIEGE
jgi:exodeoxyribonuclease-3